MGSDDKYFLARLLEGEVTEEAIYEDDYALVVRAPDPEAPIHGIVLSKQPFHSLLDLTVQGGPAAQVGFLGAISEAVLALGLSDGGYRVVLDDARPGPLHVHILGGAPLGALVDSGAVERGRELTLFLMPLGREPTEDEVELLSSVLGLEPFYAKQHLGSSVPHVLSRVSIFAARQLAGGLEGLPVDYVETSELLGCLDPWSVTSIEMEDESVVMVGPAGRVPFPLVDERALVVVGKYSWLPDPLGEPGLGRPLLTTGTLPIMKHGLFAHLYVEDRPRPFCFAELGIPDYSFLGDAMAETARENFQRLVDMLTRGNPLFFDDLLEAPPRVKRAAVETLWPGLQEPHSNSPDLDAEVLSRLIFFNTRGR